MNKIEMFKQIYKLRAKADSWLETVPSEVRSTFFDNPYVEALNEMTTLLGDAYFDEYAQSIDWFLYDWQPGFECYPNKDHPGIKIDNIDEYIEYMKEHEGFSE